MHWRSTFYAHTYCRIAHLTKKCQHCSSVSDRSMTITSFHEGFTQFTRRRPAVSKYFMKYFFLTNFTSRTTCWSPPSSRPRPRRWRGSSWPAWSPRSPSPGWPCCCTTHRISVSRTPSLFLKLYCLFKLYIHIRIIITATLIIIAIQFSFD